MGGTSLKKSIDKSRAAVPLKKPPPQSTCLGDSFGAGCMVGLAVGIALLTVSFQSVKAALMNPVESLRSE